MLTSDAQITHGLEGVKARTPKNLNAAQACGAASGPISSRAAGLLRKRHVTCALAQMLTRLVRKVPYPLRVTKARQNPLGGSATDPVSAEVDIDLRTDLHGFFGGVLDAALQERGVAAPEAVEYYLIALLADYAKPDARTHETLDRPLTLLLDEALRTAGSERFDRLRTLGDGVLYVTGFFSEHLATRGVEIRYVSTLGARAYEGAASMLERQAFEKTTAVGLFRELAENFSLFVEVLSDVADRLLAISARSSDKRVLQLYERWLRTGSSSMAAALASQGLLPVRGTGGLH